MNETIVKTEDELDFDKRVAHIVDYGDYTSYCGTPVSGPLTSKRTRPICPICLALRKDWYG